MTEMTPETLREWAAAMETRWPGKDVGADRVRAAASAWEAERKRTEETWYNLARTYRETRERMERYNGRCTILEARIEVLEPLLLRAQDVQDRKMEYQSTFCWWCGGLKHPMTKQHESYCQGAHVLAALAAEEKP